MQRFGSEKTFEAMARVFPYADLYALTVDDPELFAFGGREVTTTFLHRVPGLRHRRPLQLPFMPIAWRHASRRRYDVVVSSSHACAKGFWPARSALHLCYCYTPMRYVWEPSLDPRRRRRGPASNAVARALRSWDERAVHWVDEFAAISSAVQQRIERCYGRRAIVIHPPVDTDWFTPPPMDAKRDFVLTAGRMVAYKGFEVAIRASHSLRYPLVVAGSGPEEARLRELSASLGADVTFVVAPGDDELRDLYRSARVVLAPAEEDFGIVNIEAQACGTPVVALGAGGSLDTVVHNQTGILVPRADVRAVAAGVQAALDQRFDPSVCRRHAERFSVARFAREFRTWVVGAAAARGIVIDESTVIERVESQQQ